MRLAILRRLVILACGRRFLLISFTAIQSPLWSVVLHCHYEPRSAFWSAMKLQDTTNPSAPWVPALFSETGSQKQLELVEEPE